MPKISFDAEAFRALAKGRHDPQGVADALLIAARHLRAGEPILDPLASWLADAIEASMHRPPKRRGPMLLMELGLTAPYRREVADWYEVGNRFDWLTNGPDRLSATTARGQVADEFGIGDTTVKRYVERYRRELREADDTLE